MFLVRRALFRLAVVLGLAAAVVATAGPASAATGSVQVGPTATLVANGVALDVPVTVSVTCDEGFDSGIVDVFVSQARGTVAISGEGSGGFTCSGQTQQLVVRVFGGVYHGGPALATAVVLQCRVEEGFGEVCYYTDITVNQEIMIRGAA
jgi:hypothetical protein